VDPFSARRGYEIASLLSPASCSSPVTTHPPPIRCFPSCHPSSHYHCYQYHVSHSLPSVYNTTTTTTTVPPPNPTLSTHHYQLTNSYHHCHTTTVPSSPQLHFRRLLRRHPRPKIRQHPRHSVQQFLQRHPRPEARHHRYPQVTHVCWSESCTYTYTCTHTHTCTFTCVCVYTTLCEGTVPGSCRAAVTLFESCM
jgi:hypothetical protein